MRILVTCPGKFGDLLWAMATVRAIAETYGGRVDLIISAAYGTIVPLLHQQPYLRDVVADSGWQVQDTAPMTPRMPAWTTYDAGYDRVFHLGYEGWPQLPLPFEHWRLAVKQREWFPDDPPLKDVELGRAWITAGTGAITHSGTIAIGFTDEHFELKYGLTQLVGGQRGSAWQRRSWVPVYAAGTRWDREGTHGRPLDWVESTQTIAAADVFLGCNSALHVLAVALGVPVVLMEPEQMRWNPIFYPLGDKGPQVTLVRGLDGQPTFDARHVADTLEEVLRAVSTR
jgi:hypothetical protein